MKNLCIVGLLLSSQLSLASYDKNQVRKLGPHVKESVNTAFEKGCKPEGLDALCTAFNIHDAKKIPKLTNIVTENVQEKYSLSNNQLIDIWNLSRQGIAEAQKNKKPEGPGFFEACLDILEKNNASKKMTYGEQRIDRKLDEQKIKMAELAWQSNPDKISPATDKALTNCNNAIINSNYQLNPTWQNWALTKGVDGRLLVASAVLMTVGTGAWYTSSNYCSNESIKRDICTCGTMSVSLGVACFSLSLSTDGVKFSAMSE